MGWKVTPTVVHSINEYTSCFWFVLTPFWVHRVPGSEGPSLPGTEILQLPHFFLADKGPSGQCLLGAHFFFLELICDTVCGQAVRTSDFMCCPFWPYKCSLFVLIKFREWWCCAQKLLGLAQARKKWVPWVQRLEHHMGKLLGELFFFFPVLETQLRTLYVLGKHLSKELHPSPPCFFFSFWDKALLCRLGWPWTCNPFAEGWDYRCLHRSIFFSYIVILHHAAMKNTCATLGQSADPSGTSTSQDLECQRCPHLLGVV